MLKSATITPIAIKNRTTRLTTSDATKVMQRQTTAIAHPSRTVGVHPNLEPMLSPIQARSVNFATPPNERPAYAMRSRPLRCGSCRTQTVLVVGGNNNERTLGKYNSLTLKTEGFQRLDNHWLKYRACKSIMRNRTG